jgi:Tol biopolymer transport system component
VDNLRLYFARDDGVSDRTIYLAERPAIGAPFSSAQRLAGVAYSFVDANPAVSEDELVIVFNSTRPGGVGGADLWYSTRARKQDAFSAPQPVPVVNSPSREGEVSLSPDGCTLYFASDRPGGRGGLDFYRSHLVPSGP